MSRGYSNHEGPGCQKDVPICLARKRRDCFEDLCLLGPTCNPTVRTVAITLLTRAVLRSRVRGNITRGGFVNQSRSVGRANRVKQHTVISLETMCSARRDERALNINCGDRRCRSLLWYAVSSQARLLPTVPSVS